MEYLTNPFLIPLSYDKGAISVKQRKVRKIFENLFNNFTQSVQKTFKRYNQRRILAFIEYQEALTVAFKDVRLQETQRAYVINRQLALKKQEASLYVAAQEYYLRALYEAQHYMQHCNEASRRHYFETLLQVYSDTEKQLREDYAKYLNEVQQTLINNQSFKLDIQTNFAIGQSITLGACCMLPSVKE